MVNLTNFADRFRTETAAMQASHEIASRNEFQYANTNGETSVEPVIQNVWSQKQTAEATESTSSHSVANEGEPHFTFAYERPSMLAVQQLNGTRIATSDVNKISYVHIAPKLEDRRLSYTGSLSENASSSPSNSPEGSAVAARDLYGENQMPLKTEVKNEVYVPSGKNIINDSPWPPDFEPTVKEMRRKLYEFGGKREGFDEPPREEMRKLRQYYAVKFRSWLKDGNRDMSQLLCHYYAVAKMSNRCWERAVSIMEKYRLGLLKDMSKGLPVKQSIFQFVDRGNEEYTYDIMCKVERGEVSLQEAKQKYRMILDKRKAKINTAKRLSTIEAMSHDQEVDQTRRSSIDYDQRPSAVVNGGYHVEQNGGAEEYREHTSREHSSRPMDAGPIEVYRRSPNRTVIKQERHDNSDAVKSTEIRALNGVVTKHYNGTHFQEYNRQKVGEREYEMDNLKRRLRDVEDERDGMEKKWLDQVQNHVKEKYLIADLQKEVLLWKGKFKNLLDRVQGLECDARRDFDYSCRRSSLGEMPNDFGNPKEQVPVMRDGVEKVSVIDPPGRILHVPVTCGVPVITRDRGTVPQVYRPEPTYIYGYPSQAIHHSALVQNGMITSEYYDARRDVTMTAPEVSREQVTVATSDEADEKDVEVDVEGKADEQGEEEGDDMVNKRLVMTSAGNKAKIIVRKRSDPNRYGPGVHPKRKRLSR